MKVVKLTVPILIAVSLLAISLGIREGSRVGDGGGLISSALAAQTKPLVFFSTNVDGKWLDDSLVADDNLSQPASATESELSVPNDPYLENQWALSKIQVFESWSATMGNPEILVAVLDTGIDGDHEDLKDKVVAVTNFTDSPTANDIYGHGTHIAGIIAATSDNGIGIIGMAPESRLMNVKIADDKGRSQPSALAEAIVWAVDNGASVINISIELREPSQEIEDAVNYAWTQGAIIIAAAGNDGGQVPVYPAYYENSVAVAATNLDDTLAPLSNYGDWVDVAAPGFKIYSTLPNDSYGYKTGTSFAAPYVSGLAALLFSVATDNNGNGRLNDEVRAAIEAGSQEIGMDGVGAGRIDAANSMTEIRRLFPEVREVS